MSVSVIDYESYIVETIKTFPKNNGRLPDSVDIAVATALSLTIVESVLRELCDSGAVKATRALLHTTYQVNERVNS